MKKKHKPNGVNGATVPAPSDSELVVAPSPPEPNADSALRMRALKSKVEADCLNELQAVLDKYNCVIASKPVLVPVSGGGHVLSSQHGVVMKPL